MDVDHCQRLLRDLGAQPDEVTELLAYTENRFDLDALDGCRFPLDDEPFVAVWRRWIAETARGDGPVGDVLRRHLPQLRFPIRAGMSDDTHYRAVTRAGRRITASSAPADDALTLQAPDSIELVIHSSLAGGIPLIIARERADFVTLAQALAHRNEPVPISDSQGALMLAGYTNWSRVHALEARWRRAHGAPPHPDDASAAHPDDASIDDPQADDAPDWLRADTWPDAWRCIRAARPLFQDRLILLSDGPYSGVPAADLGLDDATWRRDALVLRREHECVHYLTRRVFGVMRNNLLDELIADYAGIVAARGRYRADWFLRFLGLVGGTSARRIDLYRGHPPLSDGAFRVLGNLITRAAETLEHFDRAVLKDGASGPARAAALIALASLRLEAFAAPDAQARLRAAYADSQRRLALPVGAAETAALEPPAEVR
ncbi:MAG: hypothetical protein AAF772_10825 [Acidobacteriota bacterium]